MEKRLWICCSYLMCVFLCIYFYSCVDPIQEDCEKPVQRQDGCSDASVPEPDLRSLCGLLRHALRPRRHQRCCTGPHRNHLSVHWCFALHWHAERCRSLWVQHQTSTHGKEEKQWTWTVWYKSDSFIVMHLMAAIKTTCLIASPNKYHTMTSGKSPWQDLC